MLIRSETIVDISLFGFHRDNSVVSIIKLQSLFYTICISTAYLPTFVIE